MSNRNLIIAVLYSISGITLLTCTIPVKSVPAPTSRYVHMVKSLSAFHHCILHIAISMMRVWTTRALVE